MIKIEKATANDARALCDTTIRAFDDEARRFRGRPEGGGPPGYDALAWHTGVMRNPKIGYYKILEGNRIVGGVVAARVSADHFELVRIWVDPDYQDRGIGAQAMRFIESVYPQARKWTLGTPGWATRNHHFYEKVGYVKVGEEDVEENGVAWVGFLYEKNIER